jgi:hypothetical protein
MQDPLYTSSLCRHHPLHYLGKEHAATLGTHYASELQRRLHREASYEEL